MTTIVFPGLDGLAKVLTLDELETMKKTIDEFKTLTIEIETKLLSGFGEKEKARYNGTLNQAKRVLVLSDSSSDEDNDTGLMREIPSEEEEELENKPSPTPKKSRRIVEDDDENEDEEDEDEDEEKAKKEKAKKEKGKAKKNADDPSVGNRTRSKTSPGKKGDDDPDEEDAF